jgi:hypothetical protein
MNFLLSLWYKFQEWRYERKCLKHLGIKLTKMYVSKEAYDALVEAINKPPEYNENLAKLLQRKAPWDDEE